MILLLLFHVHHPKLSFFKSSWGEIVSMWSDSSFHRLAYTFQNHDLQHQSWGSIVDAHIWSWSVDVGVQACDDGSLTFQQLAIVSQLQFLRWVNAVPTCPYNCIWVNLHGINAPFSYRNGHAELEWWWWKWKVGMLSCIRFRLVVNITALTGLDLEIINSIVWRLSLSLAQAVPNRISTGDIQRHAVAHLRLGESLEITPRL